MLLQCQVVASIHQPNSQITDCFDDLLLLAQGRCIFSGPWQASMGYFAGLGFTCPVYTNPSDFYLTIAKDAAVFLARHWSAACKAGSADKLATCGSQRALPLQNTN